MTRDDFWQLVDVGKDEGGGDLSRRYDALVRLLSDREPEEIVEFDRILGALIAESYRWDLWGVARLMNDGCSDDGFQDFRRWLISSGERVYREALANPDSLGELAGKEKETFFEAFGWVAREAYRRTTGKDIRSALRGSGRARLPNVRREPAGVRWKPEDLPKLFPRVYKKYVVEG